MRINKGSYMSRIQNDPAKQRVARRYSMGKVISCAAGMVVIDVGATLPDGTAQTLTVPTASGFVPTAGQTVQIVYANDSLHAGYAAAVGQSAEVPGGQGAITNGAPMTVVSGDFSSLTISAVYSDAEVQALRDMTESLLQDVIALKAKVDELIADQQARS